MSKISACRGNNCEMCKKWNEMAQRITPGGSEYYNNPDAVKEFVLHVKYNQHKKIISLVRRNKELVAKLKETKNDKV